VITGGRGQGECCLLRHWAAHFTIVAGELACERFFINAGPAVIAELHVFRIAECMHPATALGRFTVGLGFATHHPGE
jgi:hypothetical protein